jgi:hypothetical protein
MGAKHYAEERTENEETGVERIIREELKKRRWTETDLKERLKGDAEKVKMGRPLRAETVRSVEWTPRGRTLGAGTTRTTSCAKPTQRNNENHRSCHSKEPTLLRS